MAWGFSLFGDDVRQETGGKISLMGLYQSDMIFPGEANSPLFIPKFVIFVLYYELKGALQTDVTFRVSIGAEDHLVAEIPVLRRDLPAARQSEEETEGGEDLIHARIPVVLAPFVIPGPGRLKVRAHYSDGAVLKLGSLKIRVVPTEDYKNLMQAPQESKNL